MDSKLRFISHIKIIKSRAMKLLGLLYRFTEISQIDALSTYFKTIVMPTIEHCAPIWGMSAETNILKLNRVYNFFCAIVRNRIHTFSNVSNHDILARLNILPFSARRKLMDFKFLHDIVNGNIRCNDILPNIHFRVPNRNTRLTTLFSVPRPRTSITKRSIFYRLPTSYNSLHKPQPEIFFNKARFSKQVRSHLVNSLTQLN